MADTELLTPTVFISSANAAPIIVYPINPSSSNPPVRVKRRQVKVACTNCQRACKKCDDARPCLRCIKYSIPHACVDAKRKARRKGIKRGPYRKHKDKNRTTDDEYVGSSAAEDQGSPASHDVDTQEGPSTPPFVAPVEESYPAAAYDQFTPHVYPVDGTHQKHTDDPSLFYPIPTPQHQHQYSYQSTVQSAFSPQQTPYYQPQAYQAEPVYEPQPTSYYPTNFMVHHRPEQQMTPCYMYQYHHRPYPGST